MDPIEINGDAPDFNLADLEGERHSLSDYRGKFVIINFWSAECPWAERADDLLNGMISDWGDEVVWISIASNANESMDMLKTVSAKRELPIVFVDVDQTVADKYHAQTTPHFFVVDASGFLRYRGAIDDASFRQSTPSRDYLRLAMESLLRSESPAPAETNPYGCALVRISP